MPPKKDPPLADEERARRILELAAEASTSDDPEAFDRTFAKMMQSGQEVKGRTPADKPTRTVS